MSKALASMEATQLLSWLTGSMAWHCTMSSNAWAEHSRCSSHCLPLHLGLHFHFKARNCSVSSGTAAYSWDCVPRFPQKSDLTDSCWDLYMKISSRQSVPLLDTFQPQILLDNNHLEEGANQQSCASAHCPQMMADIAHFTFIGSGRCKSLCCWKVGNH